MARAVENLPTQPIKVLVDGNHCPKIKIPTEAIIQGDKTVPAIAAASIIAKVTRDSEMVCLDETYPGYGFAKHKGYPTAYHLQALNKLGVTALHRRSFSPVKRLLTEEVD